MLPKKHRLSKSAEVRKTTARGRSFFNPYFTIKSSKDTDRVKVTVIVSVKVSKKAVVRNKIKRIIRETVRINIDNFQSGSYVFIAKIKAGELPSAELKKQVLSALKIGKFIK